MDSVRQMAKYDKLWGCFRQDLIYLSLTNSIAMSTKNVIIRPATEQDLPLLLSFEQDLIAAERPFDPTLVPGKFNYYNLAALIQSPDACVLVAEVNQQVVASGHATIREGKHYNDFARYAFLGFMYTIPEFRGQGYIQQIIAALSDWAAQRGLTEMRLQVYDENIPAVKAYEKVGFKKILTEMRAEIRKT